MAIHKSTPGPWRAEGHRVVADLVGPNYPDLVEIVAERVAPHNRPLIVEAPRLADALEELLAHFTPAFPIDVAAAAKARAVLRAAGRIP